MTYPLRKVTAVQDVTNKYCRPNEGSRVHTLECGHNVVTKQSQGYQSRKRCRSCALNQPPPPPHDTHG